MGDSWRHLEEEGEMLQKERGTARENVRLDEVRVSFQTGFRGNGRVWLVQVGV